MISTMKELFFASILSCLVLMGCNREVRSARMLYPDTCLSVLQIDQRIIKTNGLDSQIDREKSQVGISFDGFARLGIDLSKADYDWKRDENMMIVSLPNPEITDIGVDKTEVWDRYTNGLDAEKLDKLEVELCNKARNEFGNVATNSFYVSIAHRIARKHIRDFYTRHNPNLTIVFKNKD